MKTLASGYITLLKTVIGSGVLSFPYLFKTYGIMTGVFLTIISGAFSSLGLILYMKCSQDIGRTSNLSKLASYSVPYTKFIVDFAVFFKCFGVASSYLIVTRQLLPLVLHTIFGEFFFTRPKIALLLFLVLIGPFSYLTKIDKLKYTSFCGVLAIIIVIMASFYRYFYTEFPYKIPVYFATPISTHWLGGFGKFIFAFTCHQNIFAVYSEIEDNSFNRMKKLIYVITVSAFLIYISFGISNYLLYGTLVRSNVLENYPNDPLATIVRGLYILVMGVSYPLQVTPCRLYFINMTNISTSKKIHSLVSFIVTTAIIVVTYLIAASGMDLGLIYSLIGATASTFICLILPALVYFNLDVDRSFFLEIFSYCAFLFGVFVFITTILSIIIDHINKY